MISKNTQLPSFSHLFETVFEDETSKLMGLNMLSETKSSKSSLNDFY